MKNYNKNVKSSYLQYLDANNLYGWAMCQKLPISGFRWAKKLSIYTDEAIKLYDENGNYGATLEVDIEYPTMARINHKNLPFLSERRKTNKVHKPVTTLDDKEKYIIHISALKQALDHGLKLKKLHRVIEFKQEAMLKRYIDMNTNLRKNTKNKLEKKLLQVDE